MIVNALAGNDLLPQSVVVGELAQELSRVFEILRRELHARASQSVRHRRRCIREHGDVGGHRFEQRHAESFVLGQ